MQRQKKSAAAITGTGAISAAGISVNESWQAILNASTRSCPVPAWLFQTSLSHPVFAGPHDCLTDTAKALLATLPHQPHFTRTIQLALSAVAEALAQANLSIENLRQKRIGIAIGTTVGTGFNDETYFSKWKADEKPALDPICFFLDSNIAQALHRILGTNGPSIVVTNACASSTDAIGIAKDWIENDLCDIALAGGADELSRVAYNGFASLMLVDAVQCRPFDRDRAGLNLGEGAGIFLMESSESAHTREQTILGIVRGYGAASDAYHPTAPHPEGRGLIRALQLAFNEADVSAKDIALVNAHGTGTPANDQAETNALAHFFKGTQTAIVSTKGITGHTLGAAGGLEAVFTLVALRAGLTKGSAGAQAADTQFQIAPLLQNEERTLTSPYGLSDSLAFGGGNSVLILEAYK
jgi:3-oxoacyl-[acyl-carrier-protein] synthase-1/3-oxoacyl-[acyl-carrier-protein] synthase II